MDKYNALLHQAELLISDFPDDWIKYCEKNSIQNPTELDEVDFYLDATRGDK